MFHKLLIIASIMLFAGNVFAGATAEVTLTNTVSGKTLSGFTPTRQVTVGYISVAGTSPDRYAIATKHAQGNKIYGTTSAQTSNFQKDGTQGATLQTGDVPGAPSSTSDSAIPTGWSAM